LRLALRDAWHGRRFGRPRRLPVAFARARRATSGLALDPDVADRAEVVEASAEELLDQAAVIALVLVR
jgi:hypothetical protein